MKHAAAPLFLLFAIFLVPLALPQQKPEWTWTDRNGHEYSKVELDVILAKHKEWLKSDRKPDDPRRANLSEADLRRADLSLANLSGATLSSANLGGADLFAAELVGVELSEADLADANFFGADVRDVNFQPKTLPDVRRMAFATNLEYMTHKGYPSALFELRKKFQEGGFREAERKITYALKRKEAKREREVAHNLWIHCAPDWLLTKAQKETRGSICPKERWVPDFVVAYVEYGFSTVFFDWTSQYGMKPGRCIWILFWTFVVCALLYAGIIHLSGNSGLQRIYPASGDNSAAKGRTERVRPRPIGNVKWIKKPFVLVGREWRVLRTAMFFSLMSAFNLGFREINFGRWIRMLTREEFDFKAAGWARVLAGVQSLISFYMLVLWVLTYFGRPFE